MNLRKMLGIEEEQSARLHRQFPIKIQRKTSEELVQFETTVEGYYVGHRGKAEFVPERITVNGIPDMNIVHFMPEEINQVKKYAIAVEYPKMLGLKS